ncbi:MAG: MFS transporter [Chlamydiales bacterium]
MKEQYVQLPRVAPCLLAIIVDYMGFGLIYPIVTAMFAHTQTTFPSIVSEHSRLFFQGLAYLLYPAAMFFGAAFLGDFSDKHGRKKILGVALFGIFLSFLCMGLGIFLKSITIFLIGRAASGLFAGSQPLAQAAVADISSPETKKWNMSLISLANNVGLIFGPLVAGILTAKWLMDWAGYLLPFIFSALFALFALLWLWKGFKETYENRPEKIIGWARPFEIFFEGIRNSSIRPLTIILFFFQLSVALFYQMLSIYLSETFHYSSSLLGYFYGFIGLFFIFSIVALYPLFLHRFSIQALIQIGFFSMSISILLAGLIPLQFFIWVFSACFAIANILIWTAFLSYYSNAIDKDRQGWGMGIFTSVVAFSFFVSGWATNILPWVSPRAQIIWAGLIGLLGAVLFIVHRYKVENSGY